VADGKATNDRRRNSVSVLVPLSTARHNRTPVVKKMSALCARKHGRADGNRRARTPVAAKIALQSASGLRQTMTDSPGRRVVKPE
jgi:hypothetical protein